MTIKSLRILAAALLAMFVTFGMAASAAGPGWNATIVRQADGAYTLGNPAAKVKVTEYVSYTCPHCAHFHQEGDAALRLKYVPKGNVSVTVEQILRNPIDVTIAMLTNCGTPSSFFVRHNAFMATQDKWLGKMDSFNEAQTARWTKGPVPARLKAIASDFDFYSTMARWKVSRGQVDRCLSDAAVLARITAQTERAGELGVDSTPSFAINGSVLTGTHEWSLLAAQIDARL